MKRMRVILVLIGLFFSFATTVAKSTDCQERHCIAVVDAGSTGTRLHIYSYNLDKKNTPAQIEQLWTKKIKPGFATLDTKSIDGYLTNLFADAPEKNIPVYFYATAGMRLLSQPKQQLQYQVLQKWFDAHPQWMLLDAKTISGKLEGIFGWLAVNYKLGALQSPDKPFVSTMDMGGASVQIAIPVEHADTINPEDLAELDLFGQHTTLFVHSFLGLGQTEVSHQYLNSTNCFPNDYPLPSELTGQGNAQTCQQDISVLINSVHDVNNLVSPVLAANPNISLYAVSGLGTLVKSKPFNFKNNQFTSQDMLEQADNGLCRQSWLTLSEQYPDNDYAFINCLTSAYYYGLLVNGYGIHPSQQVNFMSDEDEPDWTLGAVLQQSHKTLALK